MVQTVSERNRASGRGRFFDGRHAVLGTVCLVLYAAMSLGLDALLRAIAGHGWFVVCLAVPFLMVLLLYGKLERLCGLPPVLQEADRVDEE